MRCRSLCENPCEQLDSSWEGADPVRTQLWLGQLGLIRCRVCRLLKKQANQFGAGLISGCVWGDNWEIKKQMDVILQPLFQDNVQDNYRGADRSPLSPFHMCYMYYKMFIFTFVVAQRSQDKDNKPLVLVSTQTVTSWTGIGVADSRITDSPQRVGLCFVSR